MQNVNLSQIFFSLIVQSALLFISYTLSENAIAFLILYFVLSGIMYFAVNKYHFKNYLVSGKMIGQKEANFCVVIGVGFTILCVFSLLLGFSQIIISGFLYIALIFFARAFDDEGSTSKIYIDAKEKFRQYGNNSIVTIVQPMDDKWRIVYLHEYLKSYAQSFAENVLLETIYNNIENEKKEYNIIDDDLDKLLACWPSYATYGIIKEDGDFEYFQEGTDVSKMIAVGAVIICRSELNGNGNYYPKIIYDKSLDKDSV